METKNWSLLFLSALLYPLPFIFTDYLWWLIFIFPAPLFFLTSQKNLTFKHGYIWGLCAFALHSIGGLYAIIHMAQGPLYLKIIPAIFVILYFPLFSAFTFWITTIVCKTLKIKKEAFLYLVFWIIALWLLFLIIDWYSFWIFDIKEGYFLIHLLLVLAIKPQLLQLLPCCGKQVLTICLLAVPASNIFFLQHKTKLNLLFFIVAILPWLFAWFTPSQKTQKPEWLRRVKTLPIFFHAISDQKTMIYSIQNELKKLLHQFPETEIVITPESAFNCTLLSTNSEITQYWDEKNIGKKIHLLLGTSRCKKEKYYNSLYWIYDGKVLDVFDKKHAMPLAERMPSQFNFQVIKNLYFENIPCVKTGKNKRPQLSITDTISFVPYICSELFLQEWPDDNHAEKPILALCNDSSFLTPHFPKYIPQLLLFAARFKAIQWQREIVYVSFTTTTFIDKNGNISNIN